MDREAFDSKYGILPQGDPWKLQDALHVCYNGFVSLTRIKKQDYKRIWLFTDSDDPNPGNIRLRAQIEQRVRDCEEADQLLYLYHLGRDFDASKYYAALVS